MEMSQKIKTYLHTCIWLLFQNKFFYIYAFFSSCSCFYVLSKTSSDPGKLKLQQIKLIKMNYFTDKFPKNNRFENKH